MYVSIRQYRMGKGSLDALMHRVDRDFADALAQEPGFEAYQAIDTGDGTVTSISIFRDREGAEGSNELAAEWVEEELGEFELTRTDIFSGEVLVSRVAAEVLEPVRH